MEAKEVISKFKRIGNWEAKKKASLYMTKLDLAEYARTEQAADQKRLDVLEEYATHSAQERYERAVEHAYLDGILTEPHTTTGENTILKILKIASGIDEPKNEER